MLLGTYLFFTGASLIYVLASKRAEARLVATKRDKGINVARKGHGIIEGGNGVMRDLEDF